MTHIESLPRWIASPFAQRGLRAWLGTRRPASVLEIGGGLGTLTQIGHAYCPRWVTVEPLTEFRRVLRGEVWPQAWSGPFEGVVLDGEPSPDWTTMDRCQWVFIEGNRRGQRAELLLAWPGALTWQRRPWDRSKGYWVIVRHPIWRDHLAAWTARGWEAMLDLLARAGAYSRRGKRR